MSSKWPLVKLVDVLSQDREYIEQPKPKEYKKLSVKLYGKGVVLDSPVDGSTLKMKRHQLAKAGQVILSEIWGKKGAIGIVPLDGEGALCTSHFFLFNIHTNKLSNGWFNAILRANYLAEQLSNKAFGTTGYAAVRPKDFFEATIPLPPLAEQQRIVARIESLAARITEAQTLSTENQVLSKVLVQSILHKLFMDLKQIYLNEQLDNLYEIIGGGTPSTSNSEYWSGDIPWITSADIYGIKDIRPRKNISKEAIKNSATALVPKGTIIVVTRVSLGKVGLTPFSLCFSQDSQALLSKSDKIHKEYTLHFLSHVAQDFKKQSRGTTISGITKGQLRKIEIPVPPIEEQHRIVTYLDNLQAKIQTIHTMQTQTSTELNAMLPAILDRAFKGEL